MLLTITDPETGKSWPVRAIDVESPTCRQEFAENMLLFGSAYLYVGPRVPKDFKGLKDIIGG